MYWYLNNDTSFKKHGNLCKRTYFGKNVRNVNIGNKYDFKKILLTKYRHYFKGVNHVQNSRYLRHNSKMYKF